jgi:hypothetical protein
MKKFLFGVALLLPMTGAMADGGSGNIKITNINPSTANYQFTVAATGGTVSTGCLSPNSQTTLYNGAFKNITSGSLSLSTSDCTISNPPWVPISGAILPTYNSSTDYNLSLCLAGWGNACSTNIAKQKNTLTKPTGKSVKK